MNPILLEQLALVDGATPGSYCTCGHGVVTATDIFCGAGGSSLGLEHVTCSSCGGRLIQVTQALNHWDLAVEAHNANFPLADHDVHDVEAVPATRFRRTDMLWASPGCGHHAYCRGPKSNDDEAVRSRATFNDVVRFTAHHRYDAVIVENVIEARLWCDSPGHREKCDCGSHFDAWFRAMTELGYEGRVVYFNSQFALPTPQSRDRLYVVFWRSGIRAPNLDFRPTSWCSACETVVHGVQTWKPASKRSVRTQPGKFEFGRYGRQYIYACPGCGGQVAPAVMGSKIAIDWSLPAEPIGDRDKPLAPNTRQRIKVGLENLASLEPVTVQVGGHLYERPGYARVWSVEDPLRAVTGTAYMGLVVRAGGQNGTGRSPHEPMQTVIGSDRQVGLVVGGKRDVVPREADEPMGAVTGRPHLGLVTPAGGQDAAPRSTGEPMHTVLGNDRLAAVIPNMEHCVGAPVDAPAGAVTTGNRHMLVQVNRGPKAKKEGSRTRDVDQPMPTVAGHGEFALVALRNNTTARAGDEPAQAVVGGGYHHGLVVYNGSPGHVRDTDEPAGTITTRDKQSLLVPYYRTGVATATARPMGAVTGRDRQALVTVTDEEIDACLFRMLQWPELLRAQMMHVHPDGRPYLLTARQRDKRGRWRELSNEKRVKMIGNAVSSPVATMLGTAVVEALL